MSDRTSMDGDLGAGRVLRRILLFVLSVCFLALFVLWRMDNPRAERVRMGLADALQPLYEGFGQPLEMLGDMAADAQDFARVYQQNEELRREIQRLRAWRDAARELEQENARLRALNNVRLPPEAGFVTGEILSDSGGPFLHTGLANVGRRDGVQDGAAVMDGAGLAGRVVGLGRRAARVLYVTDYSSRVPVIIRPSGRRALLAGDGAAAPRLDFLESPEGVRPGDRIVTSGDGAVFPPDLLVGAVVAGADGSPRARLSADIARLEFVRILRWRPDTEIDEPGGLIEPPQGPLQDVPDADDPAQTGEAPTESPAVPVAEASE